MKQYVLTLLVAGLATPAFAQIAMDGARDDASPDGSAYGAAKSVQDTGTGFGDSSLGVMDYANGSEIDAGYATVVNGVLHIFLAGNLESNFNKLEMFIDCAPGGQNRLRGNNHDVDSNGLNRMGDDGTGNGLIFDSGFEADFWFGMTCGGGPFTFYANHAFLLTEGLGVGGYLGEGGAGGAGSASFPDSGIAVAIDNSNVAGVTDLDVSDAGNVTTGVEIAIPLAFMGHDGTSAVRVCAFINGGGHDWLSNQCVGPMAGAGNLGEPRFVDFNFVTGDQFFVAVEGSGGGTPCPADLDGDGFVAGSDLALLLGNWGGAAGDIDGDGMIGGGDLAVMLGSWGDCPA